ncbi:hypothetical protein F5Y15DRAFT_12720 [Xylariaceae sp. FL0016]|nr:hypothetical protein F5Y15DRAFT_12720 [Xylariaceae sp. FL0016]
MKCGASTSKKVPSTLFRMPRASISQREDGGGGRCSRRWSSAGIRTRYAARGPVVRQRAAGAPATPAPDLPLVLGRPSVVRVHVHASSPSSPCPSPNLLNPRLRSACRARPRRAPSRRALPIQVRCAPVAPRRPPLSADTTASASHCRTSPLAAGVGRLGTGRSLPTEGALRNPRFQEARDPRSARAVLPRYVLGASSFWALVKACCASCTLCVGREEVRHDQK